MSATRQQRHPGRGARRLNIRFNDLHTGDSLTENLHAGRCAPRRPATKCAVESSRRKLPDRRPAPSVDRAGARGTRYRRGAANLTPPAAPRMPASSPATARWRSWAASAEPCTRSMNACRSRNCATSPRSIAWCSRRICAERSGQPATADPAARPLRLVIEAGLRGAFLLARGRTDGVLLMRYLAGRRGTQLLGGGAVPAGLPGAAAAGLG